jgi:hypothetical protein
MCGCGGPGPGFEQLLPGPAGGGGADEAAKRCLIPSRAAAAVAVVMTARQAQVDLRLLLHRLHYALLGWDAAAERRGAQDELHAP